MEKLPHRRVDAKVAHLPVQDVDATVLIGLKSRDLRENLPFLPLHGTQRQLRLQAPSPVLPPDTRRRVGNAHGTAEEGIGGSRPAGFPGFRGAGREGE